MDAREYIRRQFVALRRLQDGVMQGTTDEQFNWTPPGTANPIRVAFVHLVSGEDAFIGAIGGRERLWDSGGWAAKVGISAPPGRGQGWEELKAATIPVAPVLEYAAAARAATEAYLATLTPEELDRPVTIFGGERTVADILALLVVHTTGHLGEIAAIKGSQGVQGLPF